MQLILYLILVLKLNLCLSAVLTQPEQIHISYGADPKQMVITWVTFDPTSNTTVEFGINERHLNKSQHGYSTLFQDGGNERRILYIHRVILTNLTAGQTYYYHCGSNEDGWSAIYRFSAMKDGNNWSPRFAVFGDLGNYNGKSIPRLQKDVSEDLYDAILHVGDFAYDMDSDNARIGDEFMRQIEPIAAYVPYMTIVGNHEQAYNFSNYVNRFTMINSGTGDINNHFYSFNVGPAHIIAFSSEFYYFVEYGWNQIRVQYEWLENDLKEATKPENREKRPWIITVAHRPMYCSTDDGDDCTQNNSIIRKGIPIVNEYGLEDLFYKYGVDLEIWAHEHVYERMWPLYDRNVYNGSFDDPYKNPSAPVHIIAGSAGCQEFLDPFIKNPSNWSAVRISDYGYNRMTIHNFTHLSLVQVSDLENGKIVDHITIIKEKHGSYLKNL